MILSCSIYSVAIGNTRQNTVIVKSGITVIAAQDTLSQSKLYQLSILCYSLYNAYNT
jgi:hypothetical protein